MRASGVSNFPDPRATRPASLTLGQYSVITNYEGAWILFPASINMQSPAWIHAAAACGSLARASTIRITDAGPHRVADQEQARHEPGDRPQAALHRAGAGSASRAWGGQIVTVALYVAVWP